MKVTQIQTLVTLSNLQTNIRRLIPGDMRAKHARVYAVASSWLFVYLLSTLVCIHDVVVMKFLRVIYLPFHSLTTNNQLQFQPMVVRNVCFIFLYSIGFYIIIYYTVYSNRHNTFIHQLDILWIEENNAKSISSFINVTNSDIE